MSPSPNSFQLDYEIEGQPFSVAVEKSGAVLGRSETCEVSLGGAVGVSRRHASITREAGNWVVTDLGSRNGTFVNNEKITKHRLKNGDIILLGSVEITFHMEEAQSAGEAQERIVIEEEEDDGAAVASIINMDDINRLLGGGAGLATGKTEVEAPADGSWVIGVFSQIGEALLSSEDLDGMLEKVLDCVFSNLPAQRGSICLYDGETDTLTPRLMRTVDGASDEKISLSRTITREVIKQKNAVLVTDASEDERFNQAMSIAQMSIRSAMCAPLFHEGRVNGLIYVDTTSETDFFTTQQLEILTAMAVLSAVGLEQARLREDINREQAIRDRLARYSSPGVVDEIVKSGGKMASEMIAEEKVCSILFCDLSGFTSMSEKMLPTAVAQMLNAIFERLTDVIFAYQGTLDKYMGDAIMAIFGAPLDQPDHAERAVRAALLMQKELDEFNRRSFGEGPQIRMRIGINSGRCVAGDIGSPRRKDYTVIGDTVNVASRLESSVAKPGQVVVGPDTFAMVEGKFDVEELAPIQLKGKQLQVVPYLVLRQSANDKDSLRTQTVEITGNKLDQPG